MLTRRTRMAMLATALALLLNLASGCGKQDQSDPEEGGTATRDEATQGGMAAATLVELTPREEMIPVGAPAADFTARDQNGAEVHLADLLKTQEVVLIFYPKDNTPVCTKQLCAVRDDWDKFRDRKATVLGVNPASVESHLGFATEHGFPFAVISDTESEISKAYGCGEGEYPQRTVYVIKRSGQVALADRGVVSHDRIFAALDTDESASGQNALH